MVRFVVKTVIISLILLYSSASLSSPETNIRVDGLFKDRAVITINGKLRMLKVGQESPEGVKLISSDSRQAVISVDGEILTMGVSEHISSRYTEVKFAEVRIPSGQGGHYFVGGFINGRPVTFMVDTGATMVAMSMPAAKRLGIDLRKATRGSTSTANGIAEAFIVNVDKVMVGGITVYQVAVTVVAGNYPENVLLGNSFLGRIEMSEKAGVMLLRQNH